MGVRLFKVLAELNIGLQTAVDFLKQHEEFGEIRDDATPVTKIRDSQYEALVKEFQGNNDYKSKAEQLFPRKSKKKNAPKTNVFGKTDSDSTNQKTRLEEIASPVEDTTSIRRMIPIEKTAHVEEVEPSAENEHKQYLTKKEVKVRVHEIAQGEDIPQKKEIDYKRKSDNNNPNDEKGTNSIIINTSRTSYTPLGNIDLDNNGETNLERESQKEILSETTQQGSTVNVFHKRHNVFVSYSRKDSSRVQIIVNELQIKGYEIWIDKDGIESGDAFKRVIVNAIKKADVFLFFSSIDANKSSWTIKEVDVAVHLKKEIVPVKLDDSEYDDSILFDLAGLDFIDLSNEVSHAYAVSKLDKALKKKINKPKV